MDTKEVNLTDYPSIVQSQRHAENTSERYSFVSTLHVANVLKDSGWLPVRARESNSRAHQGYQKHEIRFRNVDLNRELMVGEEIPEIVLQNSHMGTASFVLMAGMYRCVCSNQLCIPNGIVEERRVRHVGYTDELVHDALHAVVHGASTTLETVERYKAIPLRDEEREAFAKAAIELRFDGDKFAVTPTELLRKRRYHGDDGHDLWTTFSRVQENVIKGGISIRNGKGQRRRSKEVRSIDESTKLNRALWVLADEMAGMKAC